MFFLNVLINMFVSGMNRNSVRNVNEIRISVVCI